MENVEKFWISTAKPEVSTSGGRECGCINACINQRIMETQPFYVTEEKGKPNGRKPKKKLEKWGRFSNAIVGGGDGCKNICEKQTNFSLVSFPGGWK